MNSDYRYEKIYSVCYLIITNLANWSEIHPGICIDEASEVFYLLLFVTTKPHFSLYHCENFKNHVMICFLYTQFCIRKKWYMLNLAILFQCSALDLTVVCALDRDKLIDHIVSSYRTYILLLSCAYLKCDKDGSFQCCQFSTHSTDFVSVYLLYCSYIFVPGIPIFLYIWRP